MCVQCFCKQTLQKHCKKEVGSLVSEEVHSILVRMFFSVGLTTIISSAGAHTRCNHTV